MKEAIVSRDLKVTLQDVDFPTLPSPNHLIIKVHVSGANPKDWAMAERFPDLNQGDDIAGVVHSVGHNVADFHPGQRVASFHEMLTPHGSYAEYAVGRAETTFHLPDDVSFEEAATIPLAGMTAALGLYQRLGLPLPWLPAQECLPLAIYGASSAVGAFAVKLASLSNIHPLICIAGRGSPYVETLLDRSKGDTIIDYRDGKDAVLSGIKSSLNGKKLQYAFDAVSDNGSYQSLAEVMGGDGGKITVVLARKKYEGVPTTTEVLYTQVGRVHSPMYPGIIGEKKLDGRLNDEDFGAMMFKLFSRGLSKGWFRGHPFSVAPGGLNGIENALRNLKDGKVSASKYVFRISDTFESQKPHL